MRVAIVGNLGSVGYRMAWAMRSSGVDAFLYYGWEGSLADPHRESRQSDETWLVRFGPPHDARASLLSLRRVRESVGCRVGVSRLIRALRGFDVVLTVDGWNYLGPSLSSPYCTFACGADLAEVAHEDTRHGTEMLRGFRGASAVLYGNPSQIPHLDHFDIRRRRFMPYAIDASLYSPASTPDIKSGPLLIFAPTHLIWSHDGHCDRLDGLNLPRGKGNDRLIRALREALDMGLDLELVQVAHGPDLAETVKLVEALRLQDRVRLIEPLDKSGLVAWYRRADIVADQFEIGSFGLIALEAMACSKPVLVWLHEGWLRGCYTEPMPVLNCHSVEDIVAALASLVDSRFRRETGEAARRFIQTFHTPAATARVLASVCQDAIGARGDAQS